MDLRWNQLYLAQGTLQVWPLPVPAMVHNAWMTSNLIGYYNNNRTVLCTGSLFRFYTTGAALCRTWTLPTIPENFWDGAQLQYSLDAGASC